MRYTFNKDAIRGRVRAASRRALDRVKPEAEGWWLIIVPVGKDRPGHEGGELRDSFRATPYEGTTYIMLVLSMHTRYAIYVELGTGVMDPRAPLRKTAGEVVPLVETYLRQELAAA